ncbi:MAG: hypothetical protein H8K09_16440 [Nitrospira sp.]|nr:hypothetical protein [Nitrospira sp.]
MNTSRIGAVRSTLLALTSLILLPLLTGELSAMALEGSAPTLVSQPNSHVGLTIDLAGFMIERDELKPNGRRYLMASHPATGINVAVVLEQVAGQASTGGCIKYLRQLKKGQTVSRGKDVALSTARDIPTLEYTLPRFHGVRLDQKSLYACMAEANVYASMHVSKLQYTDADAALFQQLLTTARLQPGPLPRVTAHQPNNAAPLFSVETVRYEARTIAP